MIGVGGTDMRYGDGTVSVMGGTTLIVVGVNCYHTLQRTNTENWKQIFPEKELRGNSPNFHFHVSVSDLYMYSHDRSAYSAAGNMWTNPGNI
jgi:hypothetical protein